MSPTHQTACRKEAAITDLGDDAGNKMMYCESCLSLCLMITSVQTTSILKTFNMPREKILLKPACERERTIA